MTRLDETLMLEAVAEASRARRIAPPNPWVGALVVRDGEVVGRGYSQAPGAQHAEIVALVEAGERAEGATLVVTLEPCAHLGRTGPCTEAIITAGIARVVVALVDPDQRVNGAGLAALRARDLDVVLGAGSEAVGAQLAPYLWQRRTGRPYVVVKVASTLDGVVAMADDTSQWITGDEARFDAHVLRAESQAVLVGAATVRADDPTLTARLGDEVVEPLRVVLGRAPAGARVHPCLELSGSLDSVLEELARRDVVQLLVEGGPTTSGAFVAAGLVNRVVWYYAPAVAGEDGTRPALRGLSTPTMEALRRGRVTDVRRLGEDVRVDVEVIR